MRYFDQLLTKLESLRGKYRNPRKPAPGAPGRFQPRAELLEDRTVPSTISWVNRGAIVDLNGDGDFTDPNEDLDGFNSVFGAAQVDADGDGTNDGRAADLARGVLDAAIDSWERTIANFNYSDGTNTFRLTVNMQPGGTGTSAVANFNDTIGGIPSSGWMTIARGNDGPDQDVDVDGDGIPDPVGDGLAWYLDPTPGDWSEFTLSVNNAFSGNAWVDANGDGVSEAVSAAINQADLLTIAMHELGHAVGFTNSSQMSGLSVNTTQPDIPSGGPVDSTDSDTIAELPFASLWAFGDTSVSQNATVSHLLTAFNSGNPNSDVNGPIHSAPLNATATVGGVTYFGAKDLMNPGFTFGERQLIPNTVAWMLQDAYGYTISLPERFGTMYASLNETSGELLVRGGNGVSDDVISVYELGSDIVVEVDLGVNIAGIGRFPGNEDLPGFQSRFPRADVRTIRLEADGGDDTILFDKVPTFIDTTIRGGAGIDAITVNAISGLASVTIEGGADDDIVTIKGDLDDDFRSDVEFRGGAGDDTLIVIDNNDEDGNDYTLTSTSLTKRLWLDSITFSSIGKLVLTTSDFDDTINVNSTSYALEVKARAGADTFNVGNGRYYDNIVGTVFLSADSFGVMDGETDTLNIDDGDGTDLASYTLTERMLTNFFEPSADLTFAHMDSVVLNANDRGNTIEIDGVGEHTDLTINANGGADRIDVGGGNYTKNILRAITLNGDGTDSLTISDGLDKAGIHVIFGVEIPEQHTYTLSAGTFVKTTTILGADTTDPTLSFNSFAKVTLRSSGTTGREFEGGEFGSVINVHGLATGDTLVVEGNGGNDQIVVGRGDLFAIGGPVEIYGGGDTGDELVIDDHSGHLKSFTFANYSIDFHTAPLSPEFGRFAKYQLFPPEKFPRFSEPVYYKDVKSVRVLADDRGSEFAISGTLDGIEHIIEGNGGSDEFFIGDGEFNANIRGPLTIDGGEGADDIIVNDTTGGSGVDNYSFATSSRMTKPGHTLDFLSVEDFTLNAGPGDNAINVHRLLSSVDLTINAGGGDDRINIGLGDFDTQVQGRVTVDGGGHTIRDTITISDSTDGPGGDSYTFGRSDDGSTFRKPTRTLTYNGVEEFVLHAGPNADAIAIDALPDLVKLTINGGPPDVAPGDSLSMTGTPESVATFTPGSIGAGKFLVGGLTVDFNGIEGPLSAWGFQHLTLVAGNRFDDLWIREDSEFTSLSEHQDPAATAALRFAEVREFVLDGSAINVDSNWTIEAGALNAAGLARFELRTGSASTLVMDHTLESPETAATIAVRSLEGGTTQHLVYGTAAKLTAAAFDQGEQGAGKYAILAALNADGEVVYFLEDEGINNLFLIDRQADVELLLAVPDARLVDGGEQLVVTGTNMTGFWLPAAEDGQLRVRPVTNMTIDIQATVFPNFQFDPLYGLDMSPIGLFHVRPVFRVADSGAGSLREAIEHANSAPAEGTAVVFFGLPGGDADPNAFVLEPLTELPAITRGNTIINGASQQAFTGDSNPFGPEIVLSGHRAAAGEAIHDIVSLYRLDGSVEDIAGENEPSATSGVSFVDGRLGQGATLAPGGFIDIPHSDNLANQVFTLSAWVRPDGPGPNDDFFGSAIVAKGLSPALGGNQVVSAQISYSTQLNRFLFGFGDFFSDATRIISADTFAPGKFYHVAATYDGAVFRLYVNGLLQGEKALVKTIEYDPTIPWTIGSAAPPFRAVGFPRTLNGVIDEVGLYNRALAAEEIESLAAVSAGGPIDGLHLASSRNLVHGLNIQAFSGDGIRVNGDANTLTGNFIGTSATGGASAVLTGIVGWWAGEGNADDVAGANDGTLVNGTTFAPGMVGQAFRFDGSTGYVDLGNDPSLDIAGSLTLSLWVNAESLKHLQYLVADFDASGHVSQGSLGIFNGRFYWYHSTFTNDDIIGATVVTPGQWYHVAVVRDDLAKTVQMYVNGQLDGAITFTGSPVPLQRTKLLGRSGPEHGDYYHGALDEVALWKRPLSAAEINALVAAGSAGIGRTVANAGDGIRIVNSTSNRIGGTTESDRNIISGNGGSGISIQGGAKNIIRGNYIGTTADGMGALGNKAAGIAIGDSAGNVIGGVTEQARNVIAANGTGVSIIGTLAGENRMSANYIGVAADGATDLGNFDGVFIGGGAAGNVIGGSLPGQRNVIAGNFRSNIFLSTMGTRVQGNYIGTDSTGTRRVESDSRSVTGIRLEDDRNSLIGGLLPEEGNLISGHEVGIQFNGQWVTGGLENARVQGNRIGTTADGEQMLSNRWGLFMTGHVDSDGVTHLIQNVQIGGTEVGAGNLISGNTNAGIVAFGPGVQGLRIEGNQIGTDIDGDEVVRNGNGVMLHDASGVTIGGPGPLAGNLIAGNFANGVTIIGGSSHVLQSNLIGTNADGNFKLGNGGNGISVENSSGNTIGGSPKGAGNVIAFNGDNGIALTGVSGGTVSGNLVGTDRLGRFLGNAGDGISVSGSTGVLIAGNAVGANAGTGVLLLNSSTNYVTDNFIGSTRLVKPFLPNTTGLRIQGGSANTIDGNTVSGNAQTGINLAASSGNTLSNNRIGVADDGNTAIGNGTGVVLAEASSNTFAGNTISGNLGSGVDLVVGSEGNRFFGNRIGTNADGTLAAGNGGYGVQIGKGARGNYIGIERDVTGNDDPSQGNTIAFNALAGVAIFGEAAVGNSIRGNSIHSNGGLGIDLGADLVTGNDYGDPKAKPPIPPDLDIGPNNLQNYPDIRQVTATANGTKVIGQLHSVPETLFIIDFYANSAADPSGHGESRRWLGAKTITTGTEGVGAISFDMLPQDAAIGEFISTTATNTVTGSTSELSTAVVIIKRSDDKNLQVNEAPSFPAEDTLKMAPAETRLSETVACCGSTVPTFDVRTADLPRQTLDKIVGNAISLDLDVAGWSWLVEPAPQHNSEFTSAGNPGEHATIDLPSSLIHEYGYLMCRELEEFGFISESLDSIIDTYEVANRWLGS